MGKREYGGIYTMDAQYYSACLQTYILFQYGKVWHES